jgi:hypothetical protein
MTKKQWLLILVTVALGTVYVIYFSGWLKPQTIRIFHTSRNLRPQVQQGGVMPSLIFGLNRSLKLTELKVVPLAAWQANPKVLPVWHLLSTSNSVPIKIFYYGQRIGGLPPAIPGDRPQPLDTNTVYRLFIRAGKLAGKHDFLPGGKLPETN